ncbi:MAG: transcription elongation factor GreA [Firmicutes bacterium]|nr:transcription elongation factor GreA [Bacillota bacterium]
MSKDIIWATLEGKKKLEARLDELVSRRAEIAANIKAAREYGDLRENAEYAAAREAQNNLEMEINEIQANLPKVKVFSYAKVETDEVNVGTKVTVEIVGRKSKIDFVITGVLESDIENNYVSDKSPIGSALMGKKVGDEIEVKVPAGKLKYKIIKIGKVS